MAAIVDYTFLYSSYCICVSTFCYQYKGEAGLVVPSISFSTFGEYNSISAFQLWFLCGDHLGYLKFVQSHDTLCLSPVVLG